MARVGGAYSRPPSSIATIEDEENMPPNAEIPILDPLISSPRAHSERLVKSPAPSKRSELHKGGGGSAYGGGSAHEDDVNSNIQVGRRSRAPTIADVVSFLHYFIIQTRC